MTPFLAFSSVQNSQTTQTRVFEITTSVYLCFILYLSTEADISEPMDQVMELHPIEYIVCATMKGVCTFASCEWDFGRSIYYMYVSASCRV